LLEHIPSERADTVAVTGHYLARIDDGSNQLGLYDFRSHRWLTPLVDPFAAREVVLSPDGQLVCCGTNRWCVLDVATGNLVATLSDLNLGPGAAERATFSPDGNWLVRFGIGEVILFDLRSRAAPQRFQVDTYTTYANVLAAFTPDSKQLVVVRNKAISTVELESAAGVRR